MADYSGTTWVDDDGSGTTGTVGTASRMNNIEAGILDAATHNRIGTFAAMPAAAAANKNWYYIATDTDTLGGLYRSDGATWVKMPNPPPRDALFGDGSDGAWTAQTVPTNVLANPGAEANITGWNGFFTGGGVGSGPTRVADAGAGSGSFAFELAATGATGAGVILLYPGALSSFTGSLKNVVPGQVVEFSGNVKAQAGAFSSLKLTTRWYDAGGALLSGGEADIAGAIQNAPVVGTWYTLSGTQVAPAGAAYAGVEAIGTFGAAGTYTMRADNLSSAPIMPGTTRSGATYTLTRDVYFTDLTVNAGVTIVEGGFRVFCQGKLSGAGIIANNGNPGSGRSFGAATAAGSVGVGWPGGSGGNGAAAGAGPLTSARWGHGGGGGQGGNGTGGFTGGGPTSPNVPTGGARRSAPELATGSYYEKASGTGAVELIGGGGGGGGGGGATGGTGGGGGGGGGPVVVVARVISGTISFQSKGGAGADGTVNGGGGGGGGGGTIHLIASQSGWTGTTNVAGGAAGAGNGTGVAGLAGAAGTAIVVSV